jgi:hypothetical protein
VSACALNIDLREVDPLESQECNDWSNMMQSTQGSLMLT